MRMPRALHEDAMRRCLVQPLPQVDWALRTLLQEKKIARASHNMFAYRLVDAGKAVQVCYRPDTGTGARPMAPRSAVWVGIARLWPCACRGPLS